MAGGVALDAENGSSIRDGASLPAGVAANLMKRVRGELFASAEKGIRRGVFLLLIEDGPEGGTQRASGRENSPGLGERIEAHLGFVHRKSGAVSGSARRRHAGNQNPANCFSSVKATSAEAASMRRTEFSLPLMRRKKRGSSAASAPSSRGFSVV